MSSKKRPSSSKSPSRSPKKAKTGALDAFFRPASLQNGKACQVESDAAFARRLAEEDTPSLKSNKIAASSSMASGSSKFDAIVLDDDDIPPRLRATQKKTPSSSFLPKLKGKPDAEPSLTHRGRSSDADKVPSTSTPKLSTLPRKAAVISDEPPNYPDLGQDPIMFNADICPWNLSRPTPYSFLAHVLSQLSQTRSRILMVNTLTNALRLFILHDPSSIVPAVYMVSNSISPSYVPTELSVGPKILSSALQSISGLSSAALRKLNNTYGDPGDVAFEAKASIRTLIPHPSLTLRGVYESLLKISRAKGNGAQKQKQSIVERLLLSAKGEEVRFIVRTLIMNLRVGAVRTTILTALARAAVLARPANLIITPDSPYYATEAEFKEALPLPDKKGKRKGDVVDEARISIVSKMSSADALLRTVFVKHPNYEKIVKEFLEGGLEGLAERVPLTVGILLHPTLGSPTRSLGEIYDRLGELPFAAEYKYDGQRAQIHARVLDEGSPPEIKIFSRHLEDMTDKYPDVSALVSEYCLTASETDTKDHVGATSFILDAEIVAWDSKTESTRSFQDLSNRPRKDAKLHDIKVHVCLFVFDLMYLNDQSLLSNSFRERRALLRKHFPSREMPQAKGGALLKHVTSLDSDCPGGRDEIESFWEVAVDSACEGLMIKLLDSGEILETIELPITASPPKTPQTRKKPLPATYEPDKRTSAWLKLKKDYVKGIGDTLDLVPIGAWHGNGRKAQWWSPVLLAVWDEELGRLVAVCKCMSGFTDSFYKGLTERYPEGSPTCQPTPLGDYEVGGLRPPLYFEPKEVWEVACAEITISPVSVAAVGQVSENRGLSVRFPRFLRVRDDKRIEDATRSTQLATLWRKRENNGKVKTLGKDDGDLIDADLEESEAEEEFDDTEL